MASISTSVHDRPRGGVTPPTGGGKQLKLPLTYAQIPGTGDIKVLNYALVLETLEADLYDQALLRLTTGGTNALGQTIIGLGLAATETDVSIIAEFGQVEAQHRDFLKAALGTKAITSIHLNAFGFDFSINTLTRLQVLQIVQTAEMIGTEAYLGAIPLFPDKKYLQLAAAIQGTEARHTAVLTELVNQLDDTSDPVAPLATNNGGRESTLTPDAVLAQISGYVVLASTQQQ